MPEDIYEQIALNIIEQQESIMGPMAIEQARQVPNFQIVWGSEKHVTFLSDPLESINKLVQKYSELFGQLSIEVCKEATASITSHLQPNQIPSVLQ